MFGKLFKNASKAFDSVVQGAKAAGNRHLGPDYLKACAFLGAGVAAADGSIDDSEVQVLVAVMRDMEELKAYGDDEIMDAVSAGVGKWKIAPAIGKMETQKLLKALDNEKQQYALAIGCAIGGADGDFDDDEKALISDFAKLVGINPADLGI
ncbi:MAG: TerB family tellurite resistance protein [Pseudomonadota bacterium]|nr:TerB family tellurite resistance protein [Pseudomonadota bacterium]